MLPKDPPAKKGEEERKNSLLFASLTSKVIMNYQVYENKT